MRQVRNPFVERDIVGIAEHVVETTGGDFDAAYRQLDEIDDLLVAIVANLFSGTRLDPPPSDWFVRQAVMTIGSR